MSFREGVTTLRCSTLVGKGGRKFGFPESFRQS